MADDNSTDISSDQWFSVPAAGQPEDGELEQTGAPARATETTAPLKLPEQKTEGQSRGRLEEIVRTALDHSENTRREDIN